MCNIQYVGETTTRLNLRFNSHRTASEGCVYVISHKKSCIGCSFSIQIIEKIPGSGYGVEDKPDPDVTKVRQTREDFWIKQLRTLYPYGLNERAFDKNNDSAVLDLAVGRFFPPLPRNGPRPICSRPKKKKSI